MIGSVKGRDSLNVILSSSTEPGKAIVVEVCNGVVTDVITLSPVDCPA
jgi:hypothetical protein